MIASTNEAYCPTLKGVAESQLDKDANCVLEIVIDGLSFEAVENSMRTGLRALIEIGANGGVVAVSAGNYGGKLGRFQYKLGEFLR